MGGKKEKVCCTAAPSCNIFLNMVYSVNFFIKVNFGLGHMVKVKCQPTYSFNL